MRKLWNKKLADLTVGDVTKGTIISYAVMGALLLIPMIAAEKKAKEQIDKELEELANM